MSERVPTPPWQTGIALAVIAAMMGGSIWYALSRRGETGLATPPREYREGEAPTVPMAPPDADALSGSPAIEYVEAVQASDCDAIIRLTAWMQERLRHVASEQGPDARERERERLCTELSERRIEQSRLTTEGVEDKHLLASGAEIAAIGIQTEGLEDLELPPAQCTWLRVTYPSRWLALRDQNNQPIRSLDVGVYTSADGQVLKAGVRGNLAIDFDSLAYDWPADAE